MKRLLLLVVLMFIGCAQPNCNVPEQRIKSNQPPERLKIVERGYISGFGPVAIISDTKTEQEFLIWQSDGHFPICIQPLKPQPR